MDWGYKRHVETYAGCQSYADKAGWDCSIHPAPDRAIRSRSDSSPYDGIIARATEALAAAAQEAGIPIVNVWLNSPVKNLPSVFPDFEASGIMAAEHLLSRGFRQFGYLGFTRDIDSRQQWHGFRETVKTEGFQCTSHRFVRNAISGNAPGWEAFVAGLENWIDSWQTPIGIYVTNDLYCRYLIEICRNRGMHVSEDVAIVGATNESAICASPAPTLTSIDLGYGQVGYRAAAMLDQLMDGTPMPRGQVELVPPAELIPRQTTDSYAAEDPLVAKALRFIAEHGHRPMRVDDVAAAVATTRRTLERRFRDSVGKSIAGEITRLRIERAKRRLVETDAPLKDIAKDAGFRVADHFYKVFTRVEGIPPSQYRRERQKAFPKRIG